MKPTSSATITILTVSLAATCMSAWGQLPTSGSPAADGWVDAGNSLAPGTYIRSSTAAQGVLFDFDVYTSSFTVPAGSSLIDSHWKAGDLVLGLGGVMEVPVPISSPTSYLNPRLVSKFGGDGSQFSPASPGPALGAFSAGNGGLGSIQVSYTYNPSPFPHTSPVSQQPLNGLPQIAANLYYFGPSGYVTLSSGYDVYAKNIALFTPSSGYTTLQSFEVLLDVTALADPTRGALGSYVPQLNVASDMALQNGSSDYTDAYLSKTGVVPEPASVGLVASVGLLTFGGLARLRRRHR
jgi:hypothetical protein